MQSIAKYHGVCPLYCILFTVDFLQGYCKYCDLGDVQVWLEARFKIEQSKTALPRCLEVDMSNLSRAASGDSESESGWGGASISSPEADSSSEMSGSVNAIVEPEEGQPGAGTKGNHYHVYQDRFLFRNQHYHVTNRYKTSYKHVHHHHHNHFHFNAAEKGIGPTPSPTDVSDAFHALQQHMLPCPPEGDRGTSPLGQVQAPAGSDRVGQEIVPEMNVSDQSDKCMPESGQGKRKEAEPCNILVALPTPSKKMRPAGLGEKSQTNPSGQNGGKMSGQEM